MLQSTLVIRSWINRNDASVHKDLQGRLQTHLCEPANGGLCKLQWCLERKIGKELQQTAAF